MKYLAVFVLIILIIFFGSYISNHFSSCNAFGNCSWFYILILVFLSFLCAIFFSNNYNLGKIMKFGAIFLSIGIIATLATWPVTYFDFSREISCTDNQLYCSKDFTIGYFSFTSEGAMKRLNDFRNEKFPFNGSIIQRGTIWPGLSTYYSYTAIREKDGDDFHTVNKYFDINNFTEFSFVFSYLVATLFIIAKLLTNIKLRYTKSSTT